jgi:hypothetical protein
MASLVPFGQINEGSKVDRPGRTIPDAVNRSPTYTIIGADYFRALGLSMRRGREFTRVEEESPTAAPVAIIDELLARRLFPNEEPIGQEIRLSPRTDGDATDQRERTQPMQIVGVAPALRDEVFDRGVAGHLYVQAGRHYRAG